MKATAKALGALLALLLVASPVAMLAVAQEDPIEIDRDLQVEVSTGSTERFGGGDWVRVDVGSTTFAVLYGNETSPNFPTIIAEYDRYLGAAEVYNETGAVVHERTPLPVRTILAQRFYFAMEFRDADDDNLIDIPHSISPADLLSDSVDLPRKVLLLNQTWELEDLVVDEGDRVTTVDFNVTARNLPYTWVGPFDEDGVLERITLAFHLVLSIEESTLDVTIYRFTVSEERDIVAFEKGTETVTGMTVNGSFKYDHYIEGWDFADENSSLALGTQVFVGNFVPEAVKRILRLEFALQAIEDGALHDERKTWDRPHLVTADKLEFADEWERVGHLAWVSDVLVDGEAARMLFQLYRAERIDRWGFRGVLFSGAFVYPQGNVIFHDPSLGAAVFVPGPETASGGILAGLGNYFVQALVVGLVVAVLAVYGIARRKSRR